MKLKITLLQIAAFVFSLPLCALVSSPEEKKIVTDTSSFIYAAIYNDSMVHIVWDRNKQITTATYILEKSIDNGISYTEVKRITDNSAVTDIMQMNKSLINAFENILYTTEGGYMRFLYNEVINTRNINSNTLYRVRTNISEELNIYTKSVNWLNTPDELPIVHHALGQPAPPSPQSCPGIGNPPSGYSNTGVTNSYTSNCCNITETKYHQASTSCSMPSASAIAPCVPSDPIDCLCSCTWDWCCIHSCVDYGICGCVPWNPCIAGSGGNDVWIVTAESSIGNNPSAGPNVHICPGESTTLHASGGASYSWSPAGSLSNPNISNPTASPNATTTYTVTAPSQGGCPGSDVVTVFVYPPFNPSAGPDKDICIGETTTLHATGGSSYSWSPAGSLNNPNISNPDANPAVTKTYTVTVTNSNGCIETDEVTVFVHPIPVPNFTASLSCVGQTTTFTDQSTVSPGTITDWSWDFGDSSPLDNTQNPTHTYANTGSYTVALTTTSNHGCIKTTTISVIGYPVPTVAFSNNSVCLNYPTLFSDLSSITGDTVTSWLWNFGDSTVNSTSQNPSHTYAEDGTTSVTLTATSSHGCSDSVIQPVIVYPLPVAKFVVDDSAGCIQHCVHFTDQSTVSSGTVNLWAWNFGDSQIGVGSTPEHCYPIPGTYTITLLTITNKGCVDTAIYNSMITAYPLPVAGFIGDPLVTTVLTPTIEFKDKSSGAVQWLYNFGDGSPVDNSQSPSHLFPDFNDADHSYIVHQLVTSQFGCIDTTDITIIIRPDYTFFVPNSFTPNGDGKNDYFFGSGIGIIDYQMFIFDRWGNLIWSCKTLELPQLAKTCNWDGKVTNTVNGIVQEDVYVWTVQLTDVFKKKHTFNGRVTIVR